MYRVTIEGIADLTEEIIDVEFSSKVITSDSLSSKIVATITIHGQISFDSDKLFMLDSANSIAAWSLTKPGSDTTYKKVSVVLVNTGELSYILPCAFVISYREVFTDQNGFFKLVVKEINPDCLPDDSIANEAPTRDEVRVFNEECIAEDIQIPSRSIIDTGGKRNELPLMEEQVKELVDYAVKLGFPIDKIHICRPDDSSPTGIFYGEILFINNDALPNPNNEDNPNSLISGKGTIAHEVIGHFETIEKGTAINAYAFDSDGALVCDRDKLALDEAQASMRAAKFAPDLTTEEREVLMKDALRRLENQGLELENIIQLLDINER